MARARNPNRDKALEIYIKNKGNIKTSKLAEILNEKPKTVSSWKSKDNWNEKIPRVGAPKGNKNAKGSKGNKSAKGAPKGNLNNLKHGNYISNSRYTKKNLSKMYPKIKLNIINELDEETSLEKLWNNIVELEASIIMAQKITYVTNKSDMSKELKKVSTGKSDVIEYEIQFAWDKANNTLSTEAAARKKLSDMIKQYEELLHKNWDLATEEQKARLELIKAQTNKLTGDNQEIEDTSDIESEIYGD